MTITRDEFSKLVLKTDILKPEYALDVLVRMAHHSSAIEGNTLTLSDTISILADDITPNSSKSMRELYEVANHREAFAVVLNKIYAKESIDTSFIKVVQANLMDHIREDGGKFKTTQNAILGADFTPTKPSDTPILMEQWVENFNFQLNSLNPEDFIDAMANQHIQFEKIHPFPDGNGRTGRMLLLFESVNKFGVPVIIKLDQREEYIDLLKDNDIDSLSNLFARNILEEQDRILRFDTTSELKNDTHNDNIER